MIKNMTRGTIVVELRGRQATIEGEALTPAPGQPSFVIYADSLHSWDKPHEDMLMSAEDRRAILDGVQAELRARGTTFEIEGDPGVSEYHMTGTPAGSNCPREGFWFTPARVGSRRHFEQGEVMPASGGDYGATIWQWDHDQA